MNSWKKLLKKPSIIYTHLLRSSSTKPTAIHPKGPVVYHNFKMKKNKPLKRRLQGRVPFDKRFEVSGRHTSQRVEGGNSLIAEDVALHVVQPTGYIDPISKRFINVPEMIPEFIVPDLTGFTLKPYVSYRALEIMQTELTAKNLFESIYAEKISDAHRDGKLSDEELRKILYPQENGDVENTGSGTEA